MLILAAFEEFIPPLSVLAAVSFANLVLGAIFRWTPVLAISAISLGALATHVVGGLIVSEAPRHAYISLLHAPVYVAWKVILYVNLLLGRRQREWVRTPRSKGAEVGRR
jgi:hypothetical protein